MNSLETCKNSIISGLQSSTCPLSTDDIKNTEEKSYHPPAAVPCDSVHTDALFFLGFSEGVLSSDSCAGPTLSDHAGSTLPPKPRMPLGIVPAGQELQIQACSDVERSHG